MEIDVGRRSRRFRRRTRVSAGAPGHGRSDFRGGITGKTVQARGWHFAEHGKHPGTERDFSSEIAVKAARGRLKFSAADTRHALEDLDIRVLPYTANHAFFLFDLPPLHADPFDRQIIVQALYEEIPVVTCDEIFSLYNGLKVLW